MKKIEWDNPNKMKIDTGHKTFDKQTNIISTGNIIANTMIGNYIRAYNDVTMGYKDPQEKGHLQNWDLDKFDYVPSGWRERMQYESPDQKFILYEIFHYQTSTLRYTHGMILTTDKHEHVKTYCGTMRPKSYEIMFTVRDYLCNNQPHEQSN